MRGRVDRSIFGVSLPPSMPATPNLIQQFAYGIAASELLQVKEKTPYPTIGDVVQPVVVIDDLRTSARQPMRRWYAANLHTSGPAAANAVIAIANEGVNKGDRVVIDLVRIRPDVNATLFVGILAISQLAIAGITSGRPHLCSPLPPLDAGTNLPQVGTFANIFTDRSITGQLGRNVYFAPANELIEIPGPFVLTPAPGGVDAHVFCFQHSGAADGNTIRWEMYGHEYPG